MGVVATQAGGSGSLQALKVLYLDSDGTLIADPSQSLPRNGTFSFSSTIASAFLPSGYPRSVAPDYLSYQIYDTIQGLSSYVRGMLSTQAMLTGIGVGVATATPASAVVQFVYRDAVGLLAGVLFAAIQGSSFDSYAKQWRLFADLANDIGLTAELAAPAFSSSTSFLFLACIGSICRAVTGVAGGATRMALTHHFALENNSADIAAKEGSQETAVTLIGMVVGLGLTRIAASNAAAAWAAFIALTIVHVYANIRAMRCLCITRLNAERLDIIIKHYRETKTIPTPMEVALLERLLPPFVDRVLCTIVNGVKNMFRVKISKQHWDIEVQPDLTTLNPPARKLVAESFSRILDISTSGTVQNNNTSRSIVVPDPESKKLYVFVQQQQQGQQLLGGGSGEDLKVSECHQLVQGYCKARSMALQFENTSKLNEDKLVIKNVAAVVGVGWVNLLKAGGWCCDRPALSQGHMKLQWGDTSTTAMKKEM